jgi:hypothetical protein
MVRELEVSEEKKTIQLSSGAGFTGGRFTTTLNLVDPADTARELFRVFSFEDAITSSQINALATENKLLKKRVLVPNEMERLVHLLRTNPSELRSDGRPTNDDLLADRLEAMLKS